MPIYFVSGFMRCGTSMMMRALETGGLRAAYNPARDQMNRTHGDAHYQPNASGFYELHRSQCRDPDFPATYEGMLVKLLWGGAIRLPARSSEDPYKIALMRRDPREISRSIEGFLQIHSPKTPPPFRPERIQSALDRTESLLSKRPDVELSVVWYRQLVEDPLRRFNQLQAAGWPINAHKAALVVDPDCYRFRNEDDKNGS